MTKQEIFRQIDENPAKAFLDHTGDDITAELASIPAQLRRGIIAYAILGIRPGGFLCSVFANDLCKAALRADHICREYLIEIVKFTANSLPVECCGSYAAVDDWVSKGGLVGRDESE